MQQNKFTFIDLFSGIGGFKLGLSRNGGQCVGFSEIDKDAIEAYCSNFGTPKSLNYGDITKISELPNHDVLTAGVPCQSWSIAGRNLGFDDDRGQLWNDTIYLLKKAQPKAFIFENVKGLADPRNKEALHLILQRIKEAGYHAQHFVLNSFDYGVPQNRVRVYIVGFKNQEAFNKFHIKEPLAEKKTLAQILGLPAPTTRNHFTEKDLFGEPILPRQMSMSQKNGYNDYFLFNDIRNGETTIHSWDLVDTSDRQKDICYLLLRNRRKSKYGELDGNPLSLEHFQELDSSIKKSEVEELVKLELLKIEPFRFELSGDAPIPNGLSEQESSLLSLFKNKSVSTDQLKLNRDLKIKRISIQKTLTSLLDRGLISCVEERYDFKNRKISTGLNGVNRIFLPSSDIFSTLVASDTNDYITDVNVEKSSRAEYRENFIEEVYLKNRYRKISKSEACRIQGFPDKFILPDSRSRWMKLIGNSVSVPVIEMLCQGIVESGALEIGTGT